ncbi:hypothetical protein APUTEX25_004625 [Auxenochlorella protothecoides]|uniref:FAD-binding domain-containing protein n=1 Tax=Auxenochlorella protothecoides TaxID=3075 RepID=A0A3M7L4D1_AUXPR|nr:hypothetical protein APUTEX25_004625 [Auxenochlorella protothecoides]|eukprot:RMZ56402.1 hypothetical protein APUTEX25_004625 [Auxenochlorella protothecoides]
MGADLVVEASGRRSSLPEWLAEKGWAPPPERRVLAKVVAASLTVSWPEDWDCHKAFSLYICKTQPHGKRGGVLLPIEGRAWQLTLAELGGTRAPCTWEGVLEAAKQLPDPTMHSVLQRCKPLTPVNNYGGWPNIRRCYDLCPLPRGLLVVGDAVQGLNPVYGQGMTVAAQTALLLRRQLTEALAGARDLPARRHRLAGLSGQAFQRALATDVLEPAWALAAGTDLRYPMTTVSGPGARRLPASLTATLDCLARVAQRDARIYGLVLAVAHLAAPSRVLLVPRVLFNLAWQLLKEALARASRRLLGTGAGGRGGEEQEGLVTVAAT